MSKADWIWMPHPGHFISGSRCEFRLNTFVNGYIVSTVGELRDSTIGHVSDVWRPEQRGRHFRDIGLERKYETMVFPAKKAKHSCCPWEMEHPTELDCEGYNDPGEAYAGHLAMCEKYDAKDPK